MIDVIRHFDFEAQKHAAKNPDSRRLSQRLDFRQPTGTDPD